MNDVARPLILGHRGAMGVAPENTSISFKKALKQGADGVEFDVHMTADGQLVVIHDERIDRTTDGKGFIRDLTFEDLSKYDAGGFFGEEFSGERILSLEQTLDIVYDSSVINIEIKNGPIFYPGIEERIIEVIKGYNLIDKVIISSFNHYSIKKVKEITPELRCGLLYMAGLYQPWKYAQTVGVEAIHPFHLSIVPQVIKECKNQGIKVNVFGVNDEKMLARVIDAGVDMIITDYPDRALELLERRS